MTEVQKIIFDHNQGDILKAMNIDRTDIDIIVPITNNMMHKYNTRNTKSEIVEDIYYLLGLKNIPRIYTAIVLFQLIEYAMKDSNKIEMEDNYGM